MSFALTGDGHLEADIRFARALKAYEADLSKEQQAILRKSTAPEPLDVVRFTAQFNRALMDKGIRRGFGSRLTNFLESIHQFASIPDILVGGSQYLPACAVWMVVRFSLMALVQASTHIDKLTSLFMEIGCFAPRYQNLRDVYPQSKFLQNYLTEYHIVIVQLCHNVLKLSISSGFSQFFNAFKDSSDAYRKLLKRWAGAIHDEISLQTAVLVKAEAEANAGFRDLVKHQVTQDDHRRSRKLRHRLARLCSTYDYQKTWRETRKLGSTTLFSEETVYKQWISSNDANTLICTGILGAGKSVLLANMIDDLLLKLNDQNTIIAYFFCRSDVRQSLEIETIFGSLARQIISSEIVANKDLEPHEAILGKNRLSLETYELYNIIDTIVRSCGARVIFVLDGLDECAKNERDGILRRIKHFQTFLRFKFCIAVRFEPDVASKIREEQTHRATFLNMPENNPDIEAFITSEIKALKDCGKLRLDDDNISRDLEAALARSSKGMFLWVALQLSALCTLNSDFEFRTALERLPRTLGETYARALQATEDLQRDRQRSLLSLLISALRPLTTEELREALSITISDTQYDPEKVLKDIYPILASCRGLIVIDEEDNTSRFVHSSVLQYLLDEKSLGLTRSDCEKETAELVLTYINYSIFETQVSRIAPPPSDLSTFPSKIAESVVGSSRISSLVFRSKAKVKVSLNNISKGSDTQQTHLVETHPFELYTKAFWCKHLLKINPFGKPLTLLLNQALRSKRLDLSVDSGKGTPLVAAATEGNLPLIKSLLRNVSFSPEERGETLWTAARFGHMSLLNSFFKLTMFHEVDWRDTNGACIVLAAAQSGSVDVFQHVLKYKGLTLDDKHRSKSYRDQRRKDRLYHAPLYYVGDELDFNYCNYNGQTSLMHAAARGNTALIKVLLDSSIEPRTVDSDGNTALMHAVSRGRIDAALLLLYHKNAIKSFTIKEEKEGFLMSGEVSKQVIYPWHEILTCAVRNRQFQTVEVLLAEEKKDPLTRIGTGNPLLLIASELGYTSFVRTILAHPDAGIGHPRGQKTALVKATQNGHLDVVQILLDDGRIDPNIRDESGRTALMFAAYNGHAAIVRALLADGRTRVNIACRKSLYPWDTALWLARGGEITRLLLARDDIDLTARKSDDDTTILIHAAELGDAEKVELLLKSEKCDVTKRRQSFFPNRRTALEIMKYKMKHSNYPDEDWNPKFKGSVAFKTSTAEEHRDAYDRIIKILTTAKDRKIETRTVVPAQK